MLQIIFLFLGITGLIKKKIKITRKRELSGAPVIFLSIIYLITGIFLFLISGFHFINLGIIGFVGVTTIIVIIFAPHKKFQEKINV